MKSVNGMCLVLALLLVAAPALAKDVSLVWEPSDSESVAGYYLYVIDNEAANVTGNAEAVNKIDAGPGLEYDVTGLPDGIAHWFTVTAYNEIREESTYSNFVTAPAGFMAAVPFDETYIVRGDKTVDLRWDPVAAADGYRIIVSTDAELTDPLSPWSGNVQQATSATLTGLDNRTGYYFAVVAVNAYGESERSNIVYSPGFVIPEPPGNLRGTTTINNVDVQIK